jgi:hypothetical protein
MGAPPKDAEMAQRPGSNAANAILDRFCPHWTRQRYGSEFCNKLTNSRPALNGSLKAARGGESQRLKEHLFFSFYGYGITRAIVFSSDQQAYNRAALFAYTPTFASGFLAIVAAQSAGLIASVESART